MKKRVKKLVLNTSNNAHKYLMLRNLFTSLLIHGKVETTEPRAKALKAYAQRELTRYQHLNNVRDLKRWFSRNIMSKKFARRVRAQLEKIKEGFIISNHRVRFRKGDGAVVVRVQLSAVGGSMNQVKDVKDTMQNSKSADQAEGNT